MRWVVVAVVVVVVRVCGCDSHTGRHTQQMLRPTNSLGPIAVLTPSSTPHTPPPSPLHHVGPPLDLSSTFPRPFLDLPVARLANSLCVVEQLAGFTIFWLAMPADSLLPDAVELAGSAGDSSASSMYKSRSASLQRVAYVPLPQCRHVYRKCPSLLKAELFARPARYDGVAQSETSTLLACLHFAQPCLCWSLGCVRL